MLSVKQSKLLLGGIFGGLVLLSLSPVSASSANISHSYNAVTAIPNGALVSLDPSKTNYVEQSNTSNADQLIGVAVATNDSLIAEDPDGGNVQVATTGSGSVLVSDVNGSIAVGDQVAVSPFDGVGMKAGPGNRIIGLAQSAFSSATSGAEKQTVTDLSGVKRTISLGEIRLSIGIGTASSSGVTQNSLQRFAKSLTGHTVSTVRVVISIVVMLIAVVSLIVLIYSSIYGSIISIGRNPLAKIAIFRTLGSVLIMALAMASVATVTIFLMLR